MDEAAAPGAPVNRLGCGATGGATEPKSSASALDTCGAVGFCVKPSTICVTSGTISGAISSGTIISVGMSASMVSAAGL